MRIPFFTSLVNTLHVNRILISDTRKIVKHLSVTIGERSAAKYDKLEDARKYIAEQFASLGANPTEETYEVEGRQYANIIAEVKGSSRSKNKVIIVGAHYDTVEGSSGANDNATGLAALFESYKFLSQHTPRHTVRFIAFTLEEPPFFGSDNMGSMIHAAHCVEAKENVLLMISLDMLGFGGIFIKQEYPFKEMESRYPAKGDFLSVSALPSYSDYVFVWKKSYNSHSKNKIHDFIAPASVVGINLSDHLSFHKNKIPAIMISDTGVYRNEYYHTERDTEDSVNYRFLAENIIAIRQTIREIANKRTIP